MVFASRRRVIRIACCADGINYAQVIKVALSTPKESLTTGTRLAVTYRTLKLTNISSEARVDEHLLRRADFGERTKAVDALKPFLGAFLRDI